MYVILCKCRYIQGVPPEVIVILQGCRRSQGTAVSVVKMALDANVRWETVFLKFPLIK